MLDRIKNPLPIPEQCDNCASFDITFTDNEKLYGRSIGEWPYIYLCLACGAAVACHPNTRIPLGRMADKKTRQLRARAHHYFDPLWKSGVMTRTEAYQLISRLLGIDYEQCHISQLNIEQLEKVIAECKRLADESSLEQLKRRKEKKDAKKLKRIKREQQRTERFTKYSKRNTSVGRSRRSKQDSEADS